MDTNSLLFPRRATVALLFCTGLAASHPFALQAEDSPTTVRAVRQQQTITVKGTVNDAMGPVIGASVVEKGASTNGAITDFDGNFTISVKPGATLVISYIGYKPQEVSARSGKHITVTMEENHEMLDEVVIVGFGTQKKVNLTGSVGIATSKELESRPVASATQALQGLVAGLNVSTNTGQIGKNMSINVRGTGTIGKGSSGAPLILIDGMEGDINTVNPQDIENISVLKDAAASSIYGSRAPFGVILITTKSGKEGKLQVNYNNSFRVSKPINMPKSMDSYSFAVMMNEASDNLGVGHTYSDELMQKMLDFQSGRLKYGLDAKSETAWEEPFTQGYANTDIWAELYKKSVFSQEHNLSITGGSQKMSYYVSANFMDQAGLINFGEEGMNRYNLIGKINSTLAKWLKFNLSTRFTRTDRWQPTNLGSSAFNILGRQTWPNMPIYDYNGNINLDFVRNIAEGGRGDTQTDRYYYQGAFIIEPVKNWITNVELNYSIRNSTTKQAALKSYAKDPSGNIIDNGSQSSSLYENLTKDNYLNMNIYSSYALSLNEKHNFKVMAGFQSEAMKQHWFSVTKYGLVDGSDENHWEFDLTNGLDGKNNKKETAVSGSTQEWRTVGFFGRLNYDYLGRYLFEMNMRYDGTSRFRRGSRWQLSPSFSAGWNIAEEKFFKPATRVMNQLKLRFSYGELGNQNTTNWYPTYRVMNLGAINGSWIQNGGQPNTAAIGSLVSDVLTWEKVRTWNVGVDYGFFDGRLSGSFDYFTRYTKDMVGPGEQLPNTLGIAVSAKNNCDLKTRGWELALAWRDRLNNGLDYGIRLSLSDQQTYIDRYPGNKTGALSSYIEGRKIGEIWGFETIGIAKTQEEMDAHLATLPNGGQNAVGTQWEAGDIMYKDINGDGKISSGASTIDDHGDLKVLGDSNPHYFFGIDINAAWKGFDLRCFLQGVGHKDFWPGTSSYFWGVRGGYSMWYTIALKQHDDYFRDQPIGLEGHEKGVNLDSYYPRPIFSKSSDGISYGAKNQKTQSRYMQNAGYMRLKNLQLGYTIPKSVTSKIGIQNLRLYVSGENLFTLTSLNDIFDPETATGGWGGNGYPLSSTWSFGLSLTF